MRFKIGHSAYGRTINGLTFAADRDAAIRILIDRGVSPTYAKHAVEQAENGSFATASARTGVVEIIRDRDDA